MKLFLFIYSETCEYVNRFESYFDWIHIEEKSFSKGTTDWEIVQDALKLQMFNQNMNPKRAEESFFTRKLLRVIQIARDVSVIRE